MTMKGQTTSVTEDSGSGSHTAHWAVALAWYWMVIVASVTFHKGKIKTDPQQVLLPSDVKAVTFQHLHLKDFHIKTAELLTPTQDNDLWLNPQQVCFC